jgi:hypothetical protein
VSCSLQTVRDCFVRTGDHVCQILKRIPPATYQMQADQADLEPARTSALPFR